MNKFIVDISKLDYKSQPSYDTLNKYLLDAKDIVLKFNKLAIKSPASSGDND